MIKKGKIVAVCAEMNQKIILERLEGFESFENDLIIHVEIFSGDPFSSMYLFSATST